MTYVALLRGINVGGNSRVEMSKLKTLFEDLGCQNVSSYINSGNIIFHDNRQPDILTNDIEKQIEKTFGFAVKVLIRDITNIGHLANKIPTDWTNDSKQRTDVMFLWKDIDNKDVLDKISINPAIERVIYLPGAVVWNIDRQNVRRGAGIKLIKNDIYKHMTIRNINTVRKLYSLMSQAQE